MAQKSSIKIVTVVKATNQNVASLLTSRTTDARFRIKETNTVGKCKRANCPRVVHLLQDFVYSRIRRLQLKSISVMLTSKKRARGWVDLNIGTAARPCRRRDRDLGGADLRTTATGEGKSGRGEGIGGDALGRPLLRSPAEEECWRRPISARRLLHRETTDSVSRMRLERGGARGGEGRGGAWVRSPKVGRRWEVRWFCRRRRRRRPRVASRVASWILFRSSLVVERVPRVRSGTDADRRAARCPNGQVVSPRVIPPGDYPAGEKPGNPSGMGSTKRALIEFFFDRKP
jgi:hypothetical protein